MRIEIGWIATLMFVAVAHAQAPKPATKLDNKKIESFAQRFFEARPRTQFEEWDSQLRSTLLAEMARYDGDVEGHFPAILDVITKVAKKQIAPLKGDAFDTPFGKASFLRQPAKKSKGKGLIIGLHGGGEGAGEASEATAFRIDDCVGLYPQGIRLVHDTWNTIHGERFVLTLIERAKLFDDVDADRVYIAGFSMGGTGSWFFAGRHTDLFAAAAPGPGVFMANPKSQVKTKEEVVAIQHGCLPNVRNLPLSFYIGLEDTNTMPGTYLFAWERLKELKAKDPGGYERIEFRTFEKMAHAYPPGEPAQSLTWLSKQRRDPYPKKLVWEYAAEPFPQKTSADPLPRYVKTQFHWLRCKRPVDAMRVIARREGNEFDLEFEVARPPEIEILLNPEMIDVNQKVVVRVGGKEAWSGTLQSDLRVIFETFDSYLDRRLTFDRAIAIRP